MTVSIASRMKAEPKGQKKTIGKGEIEDQLAEMRHRAMIRKPVASIERAKSYLHAPNPDEDTAAALKILDHAWVECQRAAGR